MKIFQVKLRRDIQEKTSSVPHYEFYAASHISKVYERLAPDLLDENTAVEEIKCLAPLLAILE